MKTNKVPLPNVTYGGKIMTVFGLVIMFAVYALIIFGIFMLMTWSANAHKHIQMIDGKPVVADAEWINEGKYKGKDGSGCCGKHDCMMVKPDDIKPVNGGVFIKSLGEFVPQSEIQVSEDGRYWRCHYWDGKRRCFFAPPNFF